MGFNTKAMAGEEKILVTNLGLRIAQLRADRQMSRAFLAKSANLNTQYVYDIETGKRNVTLYVLCKIARVFNIHVAELLKDCTLSPKH